MPYVKALMPSTITFQQAKETLKQSGSVHVEGFGTLEVVVSPERKARNPATGDPVTVLASRRVRFLPDEQLEKDLRLNPRLDRCRRADSTRNQRSTT